MFLALLQQAEPLPQQGHRSFTDRIIIESRYTLKHSGHRHNILNTADFISQDLPFLEANVEGQSGGEAVGTER